MSYPSPFELLSSPHPTAFSSTAHTNNHRHQYHEPPQTQQKTTLWMGELEQWQDEAYIQQLWFNLGEKVMVKVIRDKVTGVSAGYAFVDFGTAAAARRAMSAYNGVLMPNSLKPFKLNWASGGGLIDRREDRQPEYSIFVGDLSSEITETDLLALFQSRYLSCKSAKIMTDPRTGMTRGYGFVRFSDQIDQQRALIEMQGYCIGSRAIRVSVATPKNSRNGHSDGSNNNHNNNATTQQQLLLLQQQQSQQHQLQQLQLLRELQLRQQQQQQQNNGYYTNISTPSSASLLTSPNKSPLLMSSPLLNKQSYSLTSPTTSQMTDQSTNLSNTTVFVGGLSAPVTEHELRQYFQPFGEIVYVKIPPGKGCGFVQYVSRHSAELAIRQMNGYQIGNSRIRLSWGRSSQQPQPHQQQQQQQQQSPSMTTSPSMLSQPPSFTTAMQQHQQLQHSSPIPISSINTANIYSSPPPPPFISPSPSSSITLLSPPPLMSPPMSSAHHHGQYPTTMSHYTTTGASGHHAINHQSPLQIQPLHQTMSSMTDVLHNNKEFGFMDDMDSATTNDLLLNSVTRSVLGEDDQQDVGGSNSNTSSAHHHHDWRLKHIYAQ